MDRPTPAADGIEPLTLFFLLFVAGILASPFGLPRWSSLPLRISTSTAGSTLENSASRNHPSACSTIQRRQVRSFFTRLLNSRARLVLQAHAYVQRLLAKLARCQLTFLLVPKREDLKVMNIRRDTDTATIEMTDDGFALITDAVASWLAGAEDFGVSPRQSSLNRRQFGRLDQESGELWFWGPGYAGP